MCNDTVHPHSHDLSRRSVLGGMAAAGGALLVGSPWPEGLATASAAGSYSMAMHIHASFSEEYGSMDTHLQQATANAVDVLWWTEHAERMEELNYRSVVHFDSLTGEATDGKPWLWTAQSSGSVVAGSTSTSGISSNASPNDSEGSTSLAVAVQAAGGFATYGYYADSHAAGWNYHCNIYGQTLTLDVFVPASNLPDSYLELRIGSSYHPATTLRSAGTYALSYRFIPNAPGSQVAQDRLGVVTVPGIMPGQWNTVSLTPRDDVAAIWGDVQPDDFATYALTLNAVSGGSAVSGNFDYLRFARLYNSGDVPLQTQQNLMNAYAAPYPSVTQFQGLEISLQPTHINWFGPSVQLPDYAGVTATNYNAFLVSQIDTIHAAGGVASYNHPFGSHSTGTGLKSLDTQNALVVTVGSKMVANRALGADIIETGYFARAGVDLAHHIALWDVLSSNAVFLTANGVSDDHLGVNWKGLQNNWFTSVWAASKSMGDLTAALASGRAWTAALSRFRGTLDLTADGTCPMGSVSLSTAQTRSLTVIATGLPTGSTVEVVRGVVDYKGGNSARSTIFTSLTKKTLASGSYAVPIDNTTEGYVRTQVRNVSGVLIALSNPIWMLHNTPSAGIPASRRAS